MFFIFNVILILETIAFETIETQVITIIICIYIYAYRYINYGSKIYIYMSKCVALSSSFEGAIFRIPATGASRVPGRL